MAHAPKEPQPGIIGWLDYRLPIFTTMKEALVVYPAPKNLNYFWNFGSLAGVCLVLQIMTGLFLAMHYNASVVGAFDSVERIMRDVNFGWLLRYVHAVGASMFFVVVYIHIFRGLYYGSYKSPREVLWAIGVIILVLMMATAFMGYVLPWGQMSFWGATVITNLFSAFPIVGEPIVTWLWGGFSIDNPTLNRFFALHFLLPFIIVGMVLMHIIALHAHGSNNPTGIDLKEPGDKIPFHPYYTAKDFFGFGVFFLIFAGFLFFAPNYLGHADNYIPANPMVTPAHIVPEWYFLPFYAMLRAVVFDVPLWLPGLGALALSGYLGTRALKQGGFSGKQGRNFMLSGALGLLLVIAGAMGGVINSKLGGVLVMFSAIIVLFLLPWLDSSPVRSAHYRPIYKKMFWVLVIDCIVLGWLGSKPAEGLYVYLSLAFTGYYFFHFVVLMPLLGKIEKPLPLPTSLSSPALK
jgi:quinol-cytochrome oxidoreductase complex cytochrome b subunit